MSHMRSDPDHIDSGKESYFTEIKELRNKRIKEYLQERNQLTVMSFLRQ